MTVNRFVLDPCPVLVGHIITPVAGSMTTPGGASEPKLKVRTSNGRFGSTAIFVATRVCPALTVNTGSCKREGGAFEMLMVVCASGTEGAASTFPALSVAIE